MNIAEAFGCGDRHYYHKERFVAGIECEIEGVNNPHECGELPNFGITQDGSLRNNGYEFISKPLERKDVVESFKKLHTTIKFVPKVDPFSIRTSTHVHVNCLALDVTQVRTLVLLYALFEEFFFMMVKPVRRDNIHCVPLTETPLPANYKKDLNSFIRVWSKYTALNLKRLTDLGTVEFRHLHGTNDPEELDRWLTVLENLWWLAQEVEINKASLLSKDAITNWFNVIFEPAPYITAMRPNLFEIIRNNLIDVKLSV
jgi:hypothetical protein